MRAGGLVSVCWAGLAIERTAFVLAFRAGYSIQVYVQRSGRRAACGRAGWTDQLHMVYGQTVGKVQHTHTQKGQHNKQPVSIHVRATVGQALSLPAHSPLLYTTTARCAARPTEHGTYSSTLQRRCFPYTNRASQNGADDVFESKGQARRWCSQRPGISIDRQDQCCGVMVPTNTHTPESASASHRVSRQYIPKTQKSLHPHSAHMSLKVRVSKTHRTMYSTSNRVRHVPSANAIPRHQSCVTECCR